MNFRAFLSGLASPVTRQSAARGLLAVCVIGYVVTLIVLAASGAGLQRWFFALLAWTLFAYIPLRILLEAFQTIAPGMRRTLIDQTVSRENRYRSRASIELMVEGFYDRAVVMPRIATPSQAEKAKAGAVAVLVHTGRVESAPLAVTATRCFAAADAWVRDLGAWAGQEAPGNIQIRWAGVRAVIALAALTKLLIAAAVDRGEPSLTVAIGVDAAEARLDAAVDYCDDLALHVDVVPWAEPPLALDVPPQTVAVIRERWAAFCDTASPALDARRAFVEAVTAR